MLLSLFFFLLLLNQAASQSSDLAVFNIFYFSIKA